MKQYILLAVFLLAITGCGEQTNELDNIPKNAMERYADFEAELGCKMFEAGIEEDGDMMMKILSETPAIAEKHGFSANDIVSLTDQYQEDDQFMIMVMDKMNKDCPEVIKLMEEQSKQ